MWQNTFLAPSDLCGDDDVIGKIAEQENAKEREAGFKGPELGSERYLKDGGGALMRERPRDIKASWRQKSVKYAK